MTTAHDDGLALTPRRFGHDSSDTLEIEFSDSAAVEERKLRGLRLHRIRHPRHGDSNITRDVGVDARDPSARSAVSGIEIAHISEPCSSGRAVARRFRGSTAGSSASRRRLRSTTGFLSFRPVLEIALEQLDNPVFPGRTPGSRSHERENGRVNTGSRPIRLDTRMSKHSLRPVSHLGPHFGVATATISAPIACRRALGCEPAYSGYRRR